jgi:DNA-damage-inducible protein J
MGKAEFIRARVEPQVKHEAESIFKQLGLSISEAVNLFYNQVILYRGLPFEVRLPSDETLQVFKETDAGENLTEWSSPDALFSSIKEKASRS